MSVTDSSIWSGLVVVDNERLVCEKRVTSRRHTEIPQITGDDAIDYTTLGDTEFVWGMRIFFLFYLVRNLG